MPFGSVVQKKPLQSRVAVPSNVTQKGRPLINENPEHTQPASPMAHGGGAAWAGGPGYVIRARRPMPTTGGLPGRAGRVTAGSLACVCVATRGGGGVLGGCSRGGPALAPHAGNYQGLVKGQGFEAGRGGLLLRQIIMMI